MGDRQPALRELGLDVPLPRRILAVDDEPDNLEVLAAVLEDDFVVTLAGSGGEALALLRERGPVDLVITDQRMPEMTGVQLLGQLAELYPTTIRMVLTGYADIEPMIEAINCGDVYRFLLKPFDARELRGAVQDALELSWANQTLRLLVGELERQNLALKRTHVDIQQAQQRLVAAERLAAVGRIAAGVAHDIRNQVSIISMMMQLVQESASASSVVRTAEQAQQSTFSLLELLDCVRKLSRADRGAIEREEIEAASFVEEIVGLLGLECGDAKERICLRCAEAPALFSADVPATRQALLALLRAAVTAAGAASDRATIAFTVGRAGDSGICFSVSFPSAVIDEDVLGSLRQPVFCDLAPNPWSLGLQIARMAAEAQGGQLQIVSLTGGQAAVHLVLGAEAVTDTVTDTAADIVRGPIANPGSDTTGRIA